MWDEALIGQVGLIAEVQFLRQHGVSKMVRLPALNLADNYPEASEFLFFTRPLIRFVDHIIEAIRYHHACSSCDSMPRLKLVLQV